MRLFLAGVIVICFIYIAIQIKLNYERKVRFYKNALLFSETLMVGIKFSKFPLKEIISQNIDKFNGEFRQLLTSFLLSLNNGEPFCYESKNFTEAELNSINLFFNKLGRSDVSGQEEVIKNYSSEAGLLLENAKEESKSKGQVNMKLVICLGIVVAIIFF